MSTPSAPAQPPELADQLTPAGASSRTAIIIPGGLHGPFTPLLALASAAVQDRGARVRPITWTDDRALTLTEEEREPWVAKHLTTELAQLTDHVVLLIGRSLGSYGSVLAAERALPAIWFNPVLSSETVASALQQRKAPTLLLGGTGDDMWHSGIASQGAERVVEVPNADHALRVPGPLVHTTHAYGAAITAVEDFLDEYVWPARPSRDQ